MTGKRYDRAYFDKWYRHRDHAIGTRADLEREVTFAISAAELLLARKVESVLDVGAGEGRWQPVIHRLRPRARYAGIDSSEWAVRRWGARRNLRLGSIDRLDEAGLDGRYDLVIVADILHYLSTAVLRRAASQLAPLVGGIAYMPLFTARDASAGDHVGFRRRSAASYRTVFAAAGLMPVGMHVWTTAAGHAALSELERG